MTRGSVVPSERWSLGRSRVIDLSSTLMGAADNWAPLLGADTDAVLAELGPRTIQLGGDLRPWLTSTT